MLALLLSLSAGFCAIIALISMLAKKRKASTQGRQRRKMTLWRPGKCFHSTPDEDF